MNIPEDRAKDFLHEAIKESRDDNGSCVSCGALSASPHKNDCIVPKIEAQIAKYDPPVESSKTS